jgi:hypothetical protein
MPRIVMWPACIGRVVEVGTERLSLLDAVADVLTEHARQRHEHQRVLAEELREASRDAADAYWRGRADGNG